MLTFPPIRLFNSLTPYEHWGDWINQIVPFANQWLWVWDWLRFRGWYTLASWNDNMMIIWTSGRLKRPKCRWLMARLPSACFRNHITQPRQYHPYPITPNWSKKKMPTIFTSISIPLFTILCCTRKIFHCKLCQINRAINKEPTKVGG